MIGGDGFHTARPFVSLFAQKKVVDCGALGAGQAVKAMNNCLNAAHLIVAGEALIALSRLGVQPEVALNAINASSGRSLQKKYGFPQKFSV